MLKLLHLCRFCNSAPLLQHAKRAGFDTKEVEVEEAMNVEGGVPAARASIHSMLHSRDMLNESMRLLKRIPTEEELELLMIQQEQQELHKKVGEEASRSSLEKSRQRAKQEGGMLAASKRPLQRNPTDEEIKLLQKRRRCRFNHVVAEKVLSAETWRRRES